MIYQIFKSDNIFRFVGFSLFKGMFNRQPVHKRLFDPTWVNDVVVVTAFTTSPTRLCLYIRKEQL